MDLLWTDFLNSDWHDWRGTGRSEDRLPKPDWLQAFLADWSLVAPVPPAPSELVALHAFRADLRAMVEQLVRGGRVNLAPLNARMAQGPVVQRVVLDDRGRYQLQLWPVRQDWAAVMSIIAASFCESLTEGEPDRVRLCDNPDCRWVFYDETRNRNKRFCDDKACGNLMKVRRFRSRKRAEGKE